MILVIHGQQGNQIIFTENYYEIKSCRINKRVWYNIQIEWRQIVEVLTVANFKFVPKPKKGVVKTRGVELMLCVTRFGCVI